MYLNLWSFRALSPNLSLVSQIPGRPVQFVLNLADRCGLGFSLLENIFADSESTVFLGSLFQAVIEEGKKEFAMDVSRGLYGVILGSWRSE